jgi:diguanylate cyclase (GGDEF)-like protein
VQTIEKLWREDPNLQVVICTAYSDYSWDDIVTRLGISDRLLILKKPFDSAEVAQLAVALTQKWTMTRRAMLKVDQLEGLVQQRTGELRHAALHDKLTGLPNRAQLSERLSRALRRHKEQGEDFALLFLDFDRFKLINDSLGHECGDLLLIAIAERMRAGLGAWAGERGKQDQWMAARLGGDEFIVMVEGAGGQGAVTAAVDSLLGVLRRPYHLRGHEVYITASIGLTTSAMGYASPEEAIRDADAAMYRAKFTGRDRMAVFDRSMHEQTLARLQLETDLRKALDRGEFVLHYQPIVAADTGMIAGTEALLRWKHPTRGWVTPGDFIPLAEETGLILPLGEWVLRTACAQMLAWRQATGHELGIYMSVNLSKRQLLEADLVAQVAAILTATSLDPRQLTLEITESVIMDKPELVAPVLQQIKDMGVGLSMDDFGTGQSSLTCLHRFPTDILKIDRAFIKNLESDRHYTAVVQAIVTLANNLGMRVTAEGIETTAQLAQIQALECNCAQGYLFAPALPAAELQEWLVAGKTLGRPAPTGQALDLAASAAA